MNLLIAQVSDIATKVVPTPDQIASWSAAQTLQWLLVAVLIVVAIGAFFGMKALARSNEAVNKNYEKSIEMWEKRFSIQDARHDQQEARHAERDQETHEVLKSLAVSLQTIADHIRGLKNGRAGG